MKLLLTADVPELGRVGDVVDVAPGSARNFLLPKRLATKPTPANIKRIEEQRKKMLAEEKARLDSLRQFAQRLDGTEITIAAAANEQGHLFGSVSAEEICQALSAEGFSVRPEELVMPDHIKQLDKYDITVRLKQDITATIMLWVVPKRTGDEQSEQPADE